MDYANCKEDDGYTSLQLVTKGTQNTFKAVNIDEPPHDNNKITGRPAKTDQPGHPPSLIRVFAVRSMFS